MIYLILNKKIYFFRKILIFSSKNQEHIKRSLYIYYSMNIFPKLKKEKWVKINLNKESLKYSKVDFNDYNQCKKWIELLHRKNKTNYSYGGLFEDRSNIWKGSYL